MTASRALSMKMPRFAPGAFAEEYESKTKDRAVHIRSNDVLASLYRTIRSGYAQECVIMLPAWPEQKDIMTAIAAKNFLIENEVPTIIHVDEYIIDKLQIPEWMHQELTDDYPTEMNGFAVLYLGIIKEADICQADKEISQATIWTFAISGGAHAFAGIKYAAHSHITQDAQCTAEPLYWEMLNMYATKTYVLNANQNAQSKIRSKKIKLSQDTVKDVYLSTTYVIEQSAYVSPSLMSLVCRLIDDGAEPDDALTKRNNLSSSAWELAKVFLKNTFTYSDGLAVTKLSQRALTISLGDITTNIPYGTHATQGNDGVASVSNPWNPDTIINIDTLTALDFSKRPSLSDIDQNTEVDINSDTHEPASSSSKVSPLDSLLDGQSQSLIPSTNNKKTAKSQSFNPASDSPSDPRRAYLSEAKASARASGKDINKNDKTLSRDTTKSSSEDSSQQLTQTQLESQRVSSSDSTQTNPGKSNETFLASSMNTSEGPSRDSFKETNKSSVKDSLKSFFSESDTNTSQASAKDSPGFINHNKTGYPSGTLFDSHQEVFIPDLASSKRIFRDDLEKTLRTFRYFEKAKTWLVLAEETPGTYYCVLLGRRLNGNEYGIHKVTAKYNGQGTKNLGKLIIDEGKVGDLTRDLHKLIQTVEVPIPSKSAKK